MSQNPFNLALRFILEMAAMISLGYWGWTLGSGFLRSIFAVGFVLFTAFLWGTFRVPDDASSSGQAPVAVPGFLRLILELGIFSASILGLIQTGRIHAASALGIAVLIHYLISYDRVIWLLRG